MKAVGVSPAFLPRKSLTAQSCSVRIIIAEFPIDQGLGELKFTAIRPSSGLFNFRSAFDFLLFQVISDFFFRSSRKKTLS
jgi:hypothetical protein